MPPVSEFYARRRRFAYSFAVACALLLVTQLHLGFYAEQYTRPRAAAAPGGSVVVHRTIIPGDESGPGTRVLLLDADLHVRRSTSPGSGDAAAVLVEGEEMTAFFGARSSLLRGGGTDRGADLGQAWEVRDAVLDPARATAWIFGWHDGKIVARRRTADGWSPEIAVAESKGAARVVAGMDGARGPLVAWRDTGADRVRTAFFEGEAFAPRAGFGIGPSDFWDAVPLGGRILLVTYRREDRTFRAVTLRLQCCAECGQPPPPERIAYLDPVLLLGRSVTGVAACAAGDRLLLVLTRETLVHAGSAPAASLLPEPGARFVPITAQPPWQRLAGVLWPMPLPMLFCAFSLIFLGTSMFRERSRVLAGTPPPADGRVYADLLQRAMAHILDSMIVVPPAFAVLSEVMSGTAEAAEVLDLRLWPLIGAVLLTKAVYHAAMESTLGWTLGKKIIGLKVLQADGSRVTVRGALLRNLLRLVDGETFLTLLGGLVMVNTRRAQRLGDLLGGTIVVQDRPPAP